MVRPADPVWTLGHGPTLFEPDFQTLTETTLEKKDFSWAPAPIPLPIKEAKVVPLQIHKEKSWCQPKSV